MDQKKEVNNYINYLKKLDEDTLREFILNSREKLKKDKVIRNWKNIGDRLSYEVDNIRKQDLISKENTHFVKFDKYATFKVICGEEGWKKSKNSIEKKVLIGYIVFFYLSYNLSYINEKFQYNKTDDNSSSEKKAIEFYDLFYWRVYGDGNEGIGVGKMELNYESEEVTSSLNLFYHSQETPNSTYSGFVNQIDNKLFIHLKDSTIRGNQKDIKADVFLTLHPQDPDKKFFLGCISTSNREKKYPYSSILVVTLSEEKTISHTKFIGEFINTETGRKRFVKDVKPEIIYYLGGRQVRTEITDHIIASTADLPVNLAVQDLESLEGVYQSFNFSTNSNLKEIRGLVIKFYSNGLAYIFKNPDKDCKIDSFTERGRVRLIHDNNDINRRYLLLQFDFNPNSRSYRYTLLLFVNSKEKGYLKGIYSGFFNSQIASGRVILKKTTDGVKPLGSSKIDTNDVNKTIINITDNDKVIIDFFNDESFNDFTDRGTVDILKVENLGKKKPVSYHRFPENSLGLYKCYFATKLEPQRDPREEINYDSSTYGLVLNVVPLLILPTDVKIKTGGSTIEDGEIRFDGTDKVMLIFDDQKIFINMMFQLKIDSQSKIERVYGIFNQIENVDIVESSAFVMIKSETDSHYNDFKNLKHEKYLSLQNLVKIEKETNGAVTKIIGSWNRIISMKEGINVNFTPRQKSYRRTFWYAASYCLIKFKENSILNADHNIFLKDAYDNFKRAFNHGFGMKYFGKYEAEKDEFKGKFLLELLEEIKMAEETLNIVSQMILESETEDSINLLTKIEEFIKKNWILFRFDRNKREQ